MHSFLAGIVVGVIVLQTAVLAPTIFTTLQPAPAGALLRALFPKFFILLSLLGCSALGALAISEQQAPAMFACAGVIGAIPLVCLALIPATNRATDAGAHATFKRLHRASVLLTLTVLGAAISLPLL